MTGAHPPYTPAAIEQLREGEVQIWHLHYDRHLGRQPLLDALAKYLSLASDDLQLVEGDHGRPALHARHTDNLGFKLEFNWSHSGQNAVLAVARNLSIGVDIERLRPRSNAVALAERFFHRDEAIMLISMPADQQERAFLKLWTAKEAVLKAHGRGIGFGLHRLLINIQSVKGLQLVHMDNEDPITWQLHPLKVPSGLVGAIAWCGAPANVVYRSINALP